MRLRLLTTALLLPALAACGSKDKPTAQESTRPPAVVQQPADVIRLAGENTAKAGSARIFMTMEGGGLSMKSEGVSALDEMRGALTMSMSVGGESIDMEMRMLGSVMYMKMPQLQQQTGKAWVKLDLDELSKRTDIDFEALQQFQQNDPTQSLAYLQGASDDVKEVGKEDVRGTATTKYTGTFDLNKAKEAQTEERARKALDSIVKKLGTTTMPVTVWIDDEGRMRRMVQKIDLSKVPDAQGASGELTTTFELYDFGVDVSVEEPPAAEVGDGSALLGSGG